MYRATWGHRAPGSLVIPRFGSRLRAGADLAEREAVFEQVRLAEAPDAPSRLTAAFLFDDLALAVAYTELPGDEDAPWRVHEVILSPGAATFRGDLMWPVRAGEGRIDVATAARGYWTGRPLNHRRAWYEVLAAGQVVFAAEVPESVLAEHRGKLISGGDD
jgi:hypothetical protein